jgi:hypothetical protein
LVVILIGLGGAAIVIDAHGRSMFPLGVFCLALSIASYTAAYGLLPRRHPNRRNFLFYTMLGLVAAVLGCEMLLDRSTATVAYAAIALIAGLLANPISSPILFLHGAVYLIAAIGRSGLMVASSYAFTGPSMQLGAWTSVPILSVLVIATVYPWLPRPRGRPGDLYLGRRAADLFLFVSVLAWGGLLVSLLALLIPQAGEPESYRHVLAPIRTGVIALFAALLAWLSSRTRFGNLAWLVYAILVLGAVKLLFQDIAAGGAAALFISFGLYGGTLILAPRLLHGSASRKAETSTH